VAEEPSRLLQQYLSMIPARKRVYLIPPPAHFPTSDYSLIFLFTSTESMAQQQTSDKVNILLFKEDKRLVIEYSVTGTDRESKYCATLHAASFKENTDYISEANGEKFRLKIKCKFKFQAEPTGSSRVQTLKERDAIALSKHFSKLNHKINRIEGNQPWLWEFCLDESYEWAKWMKGIKVQATAITSRRVRKPWGYFGR
jgi:hypothetical protein